MNTPLQWYVREYSRYVGTISEDNALTRILSQSLWVWADTANDFADSYIQELEERAEYAVDEEDIETYNNDIRAWKDDAQSAILDYDLASTLWEELRLDQQIQAIAAASTEVWQMWKSSHDEYSHQTTNDSIRQHIEDLQYAQDINTMIVAINTALNAVHNNGSILDYFDGQVDESDLQELSDSSTSAWDEEMLDDLSLFQDKTASTTGCAR